MVLFLLQVQQVRKLFRSSTTTHPAIMNCHAVKFQWSHGWRGMKWKLGHCPELHSALRRGRSIVLCAPGHQTPQPCTVSTSRSTKHCQSDSILCYFKKQKLYLSRSTIADPATSVDAYRSTSSSSAATAQRRLHSHAGRAELLSTYLK